MDVYIGLDVSLQLTHICMVDAAGKIVHEGSCPSDVESLNSYFHKYCDGMLIQRLGFETGMLTNYLYRGLVESGLPVVCMEARHAHGVLKAQRIKTDRNDARGLAQLVRSGWYKSVHVKSEANQSVRTVIQSRKHLLETRICLENHIRGILRGYGIKLGSPLRSEYRRRIEDAISTCDELIKGTMAALLDSRHVLLVKEGVLDRQCRKMAKKDHVCQRLMTIPGVGPITALAFKVEVDDPQRFAKSRDVGVHVGLTPRRYASGEIDRSGRISKCGNDAVRSLLYEAAQSLLTRSKSWSSLKAWGVKIAKRSSFKIACTAVARKLAVIMHRMWVDDKEFAYGAPNTCAA